MLADVDGWYCLPAGNGNLDIADDWRGYLLPADAVTRLGLPALRPLLTRLEARFHHFDYHSYLREVQAAARYPAFRGEPLGLVALFHFLPAYLRALSASDRRLPLIGPLPGDRPLGDRLHIEQLLLVLLQLVRTAVTDQETEADLNRNIAACDEEVQQFFITHLSALRQNVLAILGGDAGARLTEEGSVAEFDFYTVCTRDRQLLQVQELADDRSGLQFANYLTGADREILRAVQQGEDRAGAAVPSSVFDRIAAFSGNPAPASAPKPLLGPPPVPLLDPGPVAFTDFTEMEVSQLLRGVGALPELREQAQRRYDEQLANLLNQLTNPVLEWTVSDGSVLPAFRLPDDPAGAAHWEAFSAYREAEREERPKLHEALAQLAQAQTLKAVNSRAARHRFQSVLLNRQWQIALRDRRAVVDTRERYRLAKMREFGVTGASQYRLTRDLYLDELLRIEEEVAPFVPFVRRAFKAALPVGTDVEFDPYRHSIDGLEFDPDTLTDPGKYLRGEVMRPLRSRRHAVPITQVNCFCLDYSKSMTHEPMRNLFKIMFLLVLGLEDRRTFDAIHFFGSDFMEAVDFEDRHTSRRVLFRVLRAITEINGVKVYYRGKGYTNISAGVGESARRITDFADRLAARNPEAHLVRSLFVLSDGEATGGILDPNELRDFIDEQRGDGELAVKGIYLNTGRYVGEQIAHLFGPGNYVETDNFEDAVVTFVDIMTRTYKAQRKAYREALKRKQHQENPQ